MVQLNNINNINEEQENVLHNKGKVNIEQPSEELKLKEEEPEIIKIPVCPTCDNPVHYQSHNSKDLTGIKKWKCYECKVWFEKPMYRERNEKYWGKHRTITKAKETVTEVNLITKKDLLKQINDIDNIKKASNKRKQKYKAFICFLYLTGARVQEVVGLRNQKTRELLYPPVLKKQIEIKEFNDKKFLVVNQMPVYKRKIKKGIPLRNCLAMFEHDKEFIEIFLDYLKQQVLYPNQALFSSSDERYRKRGEEHPSISYQMGNNIAKLISYPLNNIDENSPRRDAFNHYFRHLRLSHLAQNYGMNDSQLRNFVGWADSKMAAKYVHLGIHDLANVMMKSTYIGENKKDDSLNLQL